MFEKKLYAKKFSVRLTLCVTFQPAEGEGVEGEVPAEGAEGAPPAEAAPPAQ